VNTVPISHMVED